MKGAKNERSKRQSEGSKQYNSHGIGIVVNKANMVNSVEQMKPRKKQKKNENYENQGSRACVYVWDFRVDQKSEIIL